MIYEKNRTQIEAAAFAGMAEGFWFTVLTFLFPALLVSMAVAWLFPPVPKTSFVEAARSFFSRHSPGGWVWRMALGSLIFMPIYYFFGLLVIPVTRSIYEQGSYGLEIPSLDRLLDALVPAPAAYDRDPVRRARLCRCAHMADGGWQNRTADTPRGRWKKSCACVTWSNLSWRQIKVDFGP